jgi:hypothetical protein
VKSLKRKVVLSFINENVEVGMVLVVVAVAIQSKYWSCGVTVFIYHKGTSMYDN